MRIKLLYFSLLIINFSLGSAQTWEPVGGGVYGGDSTHLPVYSMCVYGDKLYVGGAFKYAGKLQANHIASWNGTKWDTLSCGTNDLVQAMCVFNNALCVGGIFNHAGRKRANCIALWVDTLHTKPDWYNLGKGIQRGTQLDATGKEVPSDDVVCGLTEYNGFVYVIGRIGDVGNITAHRKARWNENKGWMNFGRPDILSNDVAELENWNTFYSALAVFNKTLYLGGQAIGVKETHNKLFKYNDANINKTDKETLDIGPDFITCMTTNDSCMYVAGWFNKLTKEKTIGVNGVIKWDGKNSSVVGKWSGHGWIYSMAEYKGKLYIAGIFDSICGKPANGIACWDGKSWEPVGAGFISSKKNSHACVHSLCAYNGELYAAGHFNSSDGKPIMNIAKLNLNGGTNKKKK